MNPPRVVKVNGQGHTNAGDYDVSVSNAMLKGNGSASGTFTSSVLPGSPTVTVDQLVPPSQVSGFFCLSGVVSSGGRANLYIRDIGDGTSTFDQWQLAAGPTVTCDSNPDPGPNVLTLDSGDFQTSVAPPQ